MMPPAFVARVLESPVVLAAIGAGLVYGTYKSVCWVTRQMFCAHPTPPRGASIFITGCDTGIGHSTALLLNRKGYRVFAGVMTAEAGSELQRAAMDGDRLIPVVCDVTSVPSVQAAARTVSAATGGHLWGIVNNAGVGVACGPAEFVPLARVRATFEVNVMGIYHVLQAFLPQVRAAHGRVVNIASINGFFTWNEHTPYCVSKHGVEALTDGLRLEMEKFGVFVSVIEPGGIRTPIWDLGMSVVAKCEEEMGAECAKVYGTLDLAGVQDHIRREQQRFSDPVVVAYAIAEAIESRTPRLRYIVGMSAGTLNFLKRYLLSDGLFNAFARTIFRGSRH